ncbi:fimbrial protein [Enterobacillus tribolii]|uniref:Type 1 fimbria pilin n=1 Tax=Enterobacillus tribolii TaxID=1487935 RepID=A0A370R412_9GAMM|nr:fimbrial protein [Enterobacillus tribolii]MBW7984434.1 type 1 fimbrial protein [Enterobacillus tribolii]RDK97172.1 type 1 fimbria pilin [Enterobacillus tribolii]
MKYTFAFNRKTGPVSLFMLMASFFYSSNSAAITCTTTDEFSNPVNAITTTLPLQGGNITAGPDVAIGSVLFRQTFKPSYTPVGYCSDLTPNTTYSYSNTYSYLNTPLPLSGGSSPVGGQVYETGIPGIGIVAWYAGNGFPYSDTTDIFHSGSNTDFKHRSSPTFDIYLIKTGAISPGIISGSNLPTIAYDFEFGGVKTRIATASFSGSLNVVSQTCTTPDVYVSLGQYDINHSFTGKGSTSAWVDSSIKLTNCPRFYGTLNNGEKTFASDDGTTGTGTFTPNTFWLMLTPNTTVIDSNNGILSIQHSENSAEGVGIQMAHGTTSDAAPTPVSFGGIKIYRSEDASTQTLPLVARYIQTEDTLTPGRADATVVFLISYQ